MKSVLRLSSCVRPLFLLICLFSLRVDRSRAEIIFDNSSGNGTNVYYSLLEYGDEVTLGGTNRVMTDFQFEYYGDFVATGQETARVRIYKNDGPGQYGSPKTVLFDSGSFTVFPDYQTKVFSGLSITVPDDLIWTVQFSGLVGGTGDEAGLIFRTPPSVGSSFNDFWLKTSTSWNLFRFPNGDPVANFAARFDSGVDAPTVSIRRDAGTVVVEWTGASILQVATGVNGPYQDLPNARNRAVFDTQTSAVQFWRLRD